MAITVITTHSLPSCRSNLATGPWGWALDTKGSSAESRKQNRAAYLDKLFIGNTGLADLFIYLLVVKHYFYPARAEPELGNP
ncbi:hypothetical protein SAMN04487996_111299 [Dyadobacter soli]|uniref:Uncharacterized protein n=1 Tax=Dyadobacter soli TaxID=659014 RepID=A0A1G7MKG9_9BACT|nr:hypothetical protein SAMN04487996_111299 [Dyadobacter soli]